MNSEFTLTIISGVIIFCFSQIILFYFIKPRQDYREAAGLLSSILLQLSNKYTNFQLGPNDIDIISNANAKYISTIWKTDFFFRRHRKKKGLTVAQNINGIIGLNLVKNKDEVKKLLEYIKTIEDTDKLIKITYIKKQKKRK